MSSRFLISLLCAGAIALACGPRAHNEASTPRKTQTVALQSASGAVIAPTQQGEARAIRTDPKSKVAAQLYVRASDSAVRFALHVVNNGKKRIELTFPSGQTYDFAVLDTLGREVWRWSNGRMFTQALRNTLLAGGETMDLEETMAASALSPGKYVARATLTSKNYPIFEQREFTIVGTTVASR